MKITSLFRRREAVGETIAESNQTTSGKGGDFENNVVRVSNNESALSVAAFHRALELRANTMSQLVMEFQAKDANGGNYIKAMRGYASRINYLLEIAPNPLMTWPQLMKQAEINKICQGNAYIYVKRNMSKEIEGFYLCLTGTFNYIDNTYTVTYNAVGGVVTLTNVLSNEVIHIRNTYSLDGGLTGVPTLRYASRTLSIAATNDQQTLDNSAKGGKLKLLVQEEKTGSFGAGRAAKKELKKITDQLQDDIYKRDVILMNNIASVTPISQNAQQQELLESRKFSVKEIARLMGVPPILLMDVSGSSYKSPEMATQEFLLRTISPAIRAWEAEMTAKLIGAELYGKTRYHLCEKSLMRLDPLGQANIDKLHLETGVANVDELRSQYDLPQLPNGAGKLHYISTNLAEVGSDKLRATKNQE